MCHSTSGAKISVGKVPVKQNASHSSTTLARLAFPDRWVCEIISLVQWSQFLETLVGDSRGWPDRLVGLDGDVGCLWGWCHAIFQRTVRFVIL